MKFRKLNPGIASLLVTALFIGTSIPAQAKEPGFTFDDGIRYQVFQELKANIERLYQSNRLVAPATDLPVFERMARRNPNSVFSLPGNYGESAVITDNNRRIN